MSENNYSQLLLFGNRSEPCESIPDVEPTVFDDEQSQLGWIRALYCWVTCEEESNPVVAYLVNFSHIICHGLERFATF